MTRTRPLVTLISALTADASDHRGRFCCEPPLGVLSLAAVLRARHLDTNVIDLNLLWTRSGRSPAGLFDCTVDQIRPFPPRLLGLSSICGSYPLTLRLAKRLKRHFPGTPIVLGGPQASLVDVATLTAFPFVDFVLRGEAEETFPVFVQALLSHDDPDGQPGLTLRSGLTIRRNPDAPPILNLDSLPLPAFDGYPPVSRWPSVPLEIGRGCPFSCRFCSTNTFFRRRYRLKSIDHVLRQMTLLHRRWGSVAFNLVHDMFTADRRRVVDFCRGLLALKAPYTWTCSARTDCVDKPLLTLMRRAGCTGIFFGVETGSPRLQRLIQKDLDLRRARTVLRHCDRLNLETTASLIIGYPGETARDLRDTISFFVETTRLNRADGQLHVLAPLANTPLELEYRTRLVFNEACCDLPDFGVAQGKADRFLIKRYPSVFGNFYAFPHRLTASELSTIGDFFVSLQERCAGLLIALADRPSGPLGLYDCWVGENRDRPASHAYYRGLQFLRDFLAFVQSFYLGRGDVAVDVMWRFYSRLRFVRSVPRPADTARETRRRRPGTTSVLRLSPDVRIVSVRGDVVRVLDSLRRRTKPAAAWADRETTVSVRTAGNGRYLVATLPPLSAGILEGLGGTVDDLVRRLTAQGVTWNRLVPAQFVPEALRILERDGLVSRKAVPSL